jgi:hypothetical protein
MKKLSLVLLGALATAQVAQAAPGAFNGFYLGGQLGWTHRSDKTDFASAKVGIHVIAEVTQSAVNKKMTANGLNYGIYTGYGQNNSGFYWGGEFSIEDDNASKESTNGIKSTYLGQARNDINAKLKTSYKRGVIFALTPRIGAVIANENLLYFKLGMEFSRDKVTASWAPVESEWNLNAPGLIASTRYSTGHKTSSKNQFVFVPGIGYERAFGKLLARVEYGYNFGQKITTPGVLKGTDGKYIPVTVKYSAHVLKFGLAYKF